MQRIQMAILCLRGSGLRRLLCCFVATALVLIALPMQVVRGQSEVYLSDEVFHVSLRHQQQWGEFGRDTAAARTGRPASPMQIGQKIYTSGLGHHANGEIVLDLDGQYTAFRTTIGVQWQGGNRGSVIFRVLVDGQTAFESQPLSDSDPAQQVEVPVAQARELRLVASDAGDGIGCDMANWAEARIVRARGIPFLGTISTQFDGEAAPPPSADICGLSMIAGASGPQIAVMKPAGMFTVSVRDNEQVRLSIPLNGVEQPLRSSGRGHSPSGKSG